MRQLLPPRDGAADPFDLYPADPRPAPSGRPWVVCNMISSLDGATALDGRSGGLGGPADALVFAAVRASCDVVLVASKTAVAEQYRMPRAHDRAAAARAAAGRPPAPGLAIVTASGRIDPTLPAFAARDAGADTPLVVCGTDADTAALDRLDAEIVRLDEPAPSPGGVLGALARRGARVVLSEGGPSFNGSLHAAGVIDELCFSVAPLLAGGDSRRIIAGSHGPPAAMRLDRLLEADGLLFARYVRPDAPAGVHPATEAGTRNT